MFFYLAFIASAGLGGLIATSQLIGALANPSRADQVPEILKGLGIDLGAVSIFAFLYSRDRKAQNAQIARLSREETLANLKVRINERKTIPVSSLRGIARLVILSGPGSFIAESFKLSEPFTEMLLERGVLVVSLATDGEMPAFEFDESKDTAVTSDKRRRLWQLVPFDITEWSK